MFPPNAATLGNDSQNDRIKSQNEEKVIEKLKKIDKQRAEKKILHSSLSFLAEPQNAFGKILADDVTEGADNLNPLSIAKENIQNIPANSSCTCGMGRMQEEQIQQLSNELLLAKEELDQKRKSEVMSKELFQQSLKISLNKSVQNYMELDEKLKELNKQLSTVLEEKDAIFQLYEKEKQISFSLTEKLNEFQSKTNAFHDIEQENMFLRDENYKLKREVLFFHAMATKMPRDTDEFFDCDSEDDSGQNPFSAEFSTPFNYSSFKTPVKSQISYVEVDDNGHAIDTPYFFTPKTSQKCAESGAAVSTEVTPYRKTPSKVVFNSPNLYSPISSRKKVSFNEQSEVRLLEHSSLFMEEMPEEVGSDNGLIAEIERLKELIEEKENIIKSLTMAKDFNSKDNVNDLNNAGTNLEHSFSMEEEFAHQESLSNPLFTSHNENTSATDTFNGNSKGDQIDYLLSYIEIKNEIESELMKFAEKFADYFDAVDMERMNLVKKHQDTLSLRLKLSNLKSQNHFSFSQTAISFITEALREKIRLLEIENYQLQEQLKQNSTFISDRSNASVESLVDTVHTLRIEEQFTKKDLEDLQQKHSALTEQFMDVQAQLLECDQVILLLKEQIVSSQETIDQLQDQIAQKNIQANDFDIQRNVSKTLNSQLASKINQVSDDLNKEKEQSTKLKRDLELESENNANLKKDLCKDIELINDLNKKISAIEINCSEKDNIICNQEDTIVALNTKISNQCSALRKLNDKVKADKSMKQKFEENLEYTKELENNLRNLREQVSSLSSAMDLSKKIENELGKKLSWYKNYAHESKEESELSHNACLVYKDNIKSQQIIIDSLTSDLHVKENELEILKNSISNTGNVNNYNSFDESLIENYKTTIKNLTVELQQYKKATGDLEGYMRKIEQLENVFNDNESLLETNEQHVKQIELLQHTIEENNFMIEKLREDLCLLSNLQNANESTQDCDNSNNLGKNDITEALDCLQLENEKLLAENESFKTLNMNFEQKVQSLQFQLTSMESGKVPKIDDEAMDDFFQNSWNNLKRLESYFKTKSGHCIVENAQLENAQDSVELAKSAVDNTICLQMPAVISNKMLSGLESKIIESFLLFLQQFIQKHIINCTMNNSIILEYFSNHSKNVLLKISEIDSFVSAELSLLLNKINSLQSCLENSIIQNDSLLSNVNVNELLKGFDYEKQLIHDNFEIEKQSIMADFDNEKQHLINEFKQQRHYLIESFNNDKQNMINDFENEKETFLTVFQSEKNILIERIALKENEVNSLFEKVALLESERNSLLYKLENSTYFPEDISKIPDGEVTIAFEHQLEKIQDEAKANLQLKDTEIQSLSETIQAIRDQFSSQKNQLKRYKSSKEKQVNALKFEISNMKHSISSLKESLSAAGAKIDKYRRKISGDQERIRNLIFQKSYLSSIAKEYHECEKTMARIINGVSRDQKSAVIGLTPTGIFRASALCVMSLIKFKKNITKQ